MMPNLAQVIADGGAPTVGETSSLERAIDVIERLIKVVSEAAERTKDTECERALRERLEELEVTYHRLLDLLEDCYRAQGLCARRGVSMCENYLRREETAPCGRVIEFCARCTEFYDIIPCAYHCGMSSKCHCGLEDCSRCWNNPHREEIESCWS